MGKETAISWTDHTFNPWWGCARVSPGCQHCYAETFAKRTGHDVWGKDGDRRFFGDKHWAEPLKWDRLASEAGRPALVFCASMADVFEDRTDLEEERFRLFDLTESTPNLIWLLLTKRPQNVLPNVPASWLTGPDFHPSQNGPVVKEGFWPDNVWIGTTIEDQQRANERLPHLAGIPAPVRFLSCEPLLGRVRLDLDGIGWVIVGGESGNGFRAMDLDHARDIRDQCLGRPWDREVPGWPLGGPAPETALGWFNNPVPFFFKQVGGRTPKAGGDTLDGQIHHEWPKEANR